MYSDKVKTKIQCLSHECLIQVLGSNLPTWDPLVWLRVHRGKISWKPYFWHLNSGLNLTFCLTGMTSFMSALCSNCQEELIAIHMLKFTSTESKSNYNPEILFVPFSDNRGLIDPIKEEHIFSKSFFPWWEMEGSCAVCIDLRISWSFS